MASVKRRLEPANAQSAKSAGLIYVTDRMPGIQRRRRGRGFRYVDHRGRVLRRRADLERIARLAIPPAWKDVWICPNAKGHLQACGRDARGRKQYRYHAGWRQCRDEAKYDQMLAFAMALPTLRRQIAKDLSAAGLPRRKVVAAVVQLLEKTLIRVGNDEYARDNNSFGLTTMRNRHVRVSRSTLRFRFKGKGGKSHDIAFDDVRLARIVRRCQDLPGHELFGTWMTQARCRILVRRTSTSTCGKSLARTSPPRAFAPGQRPSSRPVRFRTFLTSVPNSDQAQRRQGCRGSCRIARKHSGHLPEELYPPIDCRRLYRRNTAADSPRQKAERRLAPLHDFRRMETAVLGGCSACSGSLSDEAQPYPCSTSTRCPWRSPCLSERQSDRVTPSPFPSATYRLQLHAGFTFDDAAGQRLPV